MLRAEVFVSDAIPPTMLAAARGDDEALLELVERVHDRVHRYGKRVCRDRFDLDDALQEAFIRLAQRPEVVRHPSALAWLTTVVRNMCLRLLRPIARRRRWGEPTSEVDGVAMPQLSPEEALERWRLVHAVHAAIAQLDGPEREVLVLRDIEGRSGLETARALGIGVPAMKSRLHRARAALRCALRRDDDRTRRVG